MKNARRLAHGSTLQQQFCAVEDDRVKSLLEKKINPLMKQYRGGKSHNSLLDISLSCSGAPSYYAANTFHE